MIDFDGLTEAVSRAKRGRHEATDRFCTHWSLVSLTASNIRLPSKLSPPPKWSLYVAPERGPEWMTLYSTLFHMPTAWRNPALFLPQTP